MYIQIDQINVELTFNFAIKLVNYNYARIIHISNQVESMKKN